MIILKGYNKKDIVMNILYVDVVKEVSFLQNTHTYKIHMKGF